LSAPPVQPIVEVTPDEYLGFAQPAVPAERDWALRENVFITLVESFYGGGTVALSTVVPSGTPHLFDLRGHVRAVDESQTRLVVEAFVDRVSDDDFVREVWVSERPPMEVIARVAERDLDQELRLHAVFVDLTSELDDPSLGDLTLIVTPLETDDAKLVHSK
jgi:hypothetical protein